MSERTRSRKDGFGNLRITGGTKENRGTDLGQTSYECLVIGKVVNCT